MHRLSFLLLGVSRSKQDKRKDKAALMKNYLDLISLMYDTYLLEFGESGPRSTTNPPPL